MLTKYQLNETHWLEVCSHLDKGARNGFKHDPEAHEVVKVDDQGMPMYTTLAAKRFNLPFLFTSPKTAVEQVLQYAYTGKTTKLKDMWYRIVRS